MAHEYSAHSRHDWCRLCKRTLAMHDDTTKGTDTMNAAMMNLRAANEWAERAIVAEGEYPCRCNGWHYYWDIPQYAECGNDVHTMGATGCAYADNAADD